MLNVLDLFAGIGGFSLGLERTGHYRTVAFCEQNPTCQRILKKHWPNVPIHDDVCTLTKEHLNERIDVITGGFPCQDISLAGLGAGLWGDRSGLWWEFHRLIGQIRPQAVLIENVSALRSRGLDQVLGSLAALGYDAEWDCIPASYIGAPHNRDRIWIVAHTLGSQWRTESYRGTLGRMGREQQSVPWDTPWQDTLCELRRMDDGSAYRVDRTDTLRNAVVPQIPEIIGRALADVLIPNTNENISVIFQV